MSQPSTLSPLLYQELIITNLQAPRRLLLLQHNLIHQEGARPPSAIVKHPVDPTESYSNTTNHNNGFDANVVMVLSVLLCALICSLGVNSIIKCALRCSFFMPSSSSTDPNNNNNPNSNPTKNTGIKKKALKTFAVVNYSLNLKLPGLGTECVICLSEFVSGEKLRLLPKCHHGFHARCIDKWLKTHSSCPTCRHCLIDTCQKIVGSGDQASSSSQPPPPPRETVIDMAPLEREDLVTNYRVIGPV